MKKEWSTISTYSHMVDELITEVDRVSQVQKMYIQAYRLSDLQVSGLPCPSLSFGL